MIISSFVSPILVRNSYDGMSKVLRLLRYFFFLRVQGNLVAPPEVSDTAAIWNLWPKITQTNAHNPILIQQALLVMVKTCGMDMVLALVKIVLPTQSNPGLVKITLAIVLTGMVAKVVDIGLKSSGKTQKK